MGQCVPQRHGSHDCQIGIRDYQITIARLAFAFASLEFAIARLTFAIAKLMQRRYFSSLHVAEKKFKKIPKSGHEHGKDLSYKLYMRRGGVFSHTQVSLGHAQRKKRYNSW